MKNIWYYIPFLVSFTACSTPENIRHLPEESDCLKEEVKKAISIYTVEKKLLDNYIHLTGTIEVNPEKVVKFHSLVNGVVSEVYFSLGDYVRKGQLLVELKSAELASLQAESRSLEIRIRLTEKNLESLSALLKDEMVTQREWQEAESELEVLKADQDKIRSHLKLYSASTEKGVFQIKAPVNGHITEKNITPGWQINDSDEPLFVISDLNEVWVMADIYASDVRHLHSGMEAKITTIADPDKTTKGKITRISQTLDPENRVLKARIPLSNTDGQFQPGMLADIWAISPEENEALAVPEEALIFYDDKHYVIVYRDDCDLDIREVESIDENEKFAFIKSGLSEGETIITGNPLLLFEKIRHN